MSATFDTVLIANRGEIARRILRTAKATGRRAVVVHHALDRDSPAVREADQAVELHGATPVAAYLDGEAIIAAAQETGADAIHPGYGFLSENADFARKVAAAGLAFVGPTPEAIALMGDKVRARAFVAERGFPVAPSAIEDDDPASFTRRAARVGFPILIKPAAGGGGKGMRIVRQAAELEAEIERARSEGQRYFGDGRLYVERYVERPRHIEVQVFGDRHGNIVHFWERECSVQRRFQKVVEEAPSPALDDKTRQAICDAAVGIAHAAGYSNAGTVEFIHSQSGEFFFLEMNTRLQVEHPVTEAITGFDLVREQLRIAAGEKLGYGQDAIRRRGHAIELRLYAEDPARNFAPTTGDILLWREPAGPGIRVDTGFLQGQAVTAAFDPMLAKLIVHGDDRAEAIARGRRALEDFAVLGLATNGGFLHRLLAHPAFVAGDLHTGLIAENPALAKPAERPPAETLALLAAAALATRPVRDAADAVPVLYAAMGHWRN